jgi:DDE family transposase
MAQPQHTPSLVHLEEALTVLFCFIDDAYALLNPHARRYESIKRLSDSEVIALDLFQQLRGVESERSFLRDAERFFSPLFPGVVGLYPSSFNRRVKKLRCYLEPLRREILPELVGEPETLLVDSTLLEVLHPRQGSPSAGWGSFSAGAAWVRWGSFSLYRVKLHLLCATNRVPISYELTPANVADVSLTEELIAEAALEEGGSEETLGRPRLPQRGVEESLGRGGHPLGHRASRAAARGKAADRERPFEPQEDLWPGRDFVHHAHWAGHQDKICAYTYAFLVNRVLGRPQGHIKKAWA